MSEGLATAAQPQSTHLLLKSSCTSEWARGQEKSISRIRIKKKGKQKKSISRIRIKKKEKTRKKHLTHSYYALSWASEVWG
jgi:hypothetical protein